MARDDTRGQPARSVFRRRVPQLAACARLGLIPPYDRLVRRCQVLKTGMPVPATTARTRRKTGPALPQIGKEKPKIAALVVFGGKTFSPKEVVGWHAAGGKTDGLVVIRNACAVAPR